MADFDLQEYIDYDTYVRDWHAETLDQRGVTLQEACKRGSINEDETRMLWQ